MADCIDNYRPRQPVRRVWDTIGPFVRELVRDAQPKVRYDAKNLIYHVAAYVYWATEIAGLPLDRTVLLTLPVLNEHTVHGCQNLTAESRQNRRCAIRRVAEAVNPIVVAPPDYLPSERAGGAQPYNAAQVTSFVSWARSRRTKTQRRNASVLVALGFGCGLTAEDLSPIRRRDVNVDADGSVTVHVTTRHERDVICLGIWERMLADAVADLDDDSFVFRVNRPRAKPGKNYVSNFIARNMDGGEKLNLHRARATWLVHHLTAGTPIPVLLPAAGLRKVDALSRYLGSVPVADEASARAWLRGVQV